MQHIYMYLRGNNRSDPDSQAPPFLHFCVQGQHTNKFPSERRASGARFLRENHCVIVRLFAQRLTVPHRVAVCECVWMRDVYVYAVRVYMLYS